MPIRRLIRVRLLLRRLQFQFSAVYICFHADGNSVWFPIQCSVSANVTMTIRWCAMCSSSFRRFLHLTRLVARFLVVARISNKHAATTPIHAPRSALHMRTYLHISSTMLAHIVNNAQLHSNTTSILVIIVKHNAWNIASQDKKQLVFYAHMLFSYVTQTQQNITKSTIYVMSSGFIPGSGGGTWLHLFRINAPTHYTTVG